MQGRYVVKACNQPRFKETKCDTENMMQTEMYLQVEMREKVVAQFMVIVMDNAGIDWNAIQMGAMPFNAENVLNVSCNDSY